METQLGKRAGSGHICFLSPDYYNVMARGASTPIAGGAEVQLSFIARGLSNVGYSVTIATYAPGETPEFELDGIRMIRIIRSGLELPLIRNVHPRLTCIWSALRKANADVYWQTCAAANTSVVALYCRVNQRPFIYSGASDPDFDLEQARRKFHRRGGWRDLRMYQWGLRRADAIVAQHKGQVASCQRWFGRDAVEIPSGYTLPEGAKASSNGVVLWVATLRTLKRPELFLELARALPHLRFRIVGGPGPGEEANLFERIRIEASGLANLEFVGFVPFSKVEAHFNDACIFVNTSDYEGFPNTFLQSWARGIPTVSFFDCGARDDGRPIGFVCRDLLEMKQNISRLCEDHVLWLKESQRASDYFRNHHTIDIAVARYNHLIRQLLDQERPA